MASVKDFSPESIELTTWGGAVEDITALCPLFQYYEDIDEPFVRASLGVIDSGVNLIRTAPIQGGELVTIKFRCAADAELESFELKFRIWKVYNRKFSANTQTYSLALLPNEAFTNQYQRVVKKLSGKPSEIVKDLLENYLQTEIELDIESTGNAVSFYPARRNVISIIKSLQIRSISQNAYSNVGSTSSTNNNVSTENSENDKKVKGTAGYLFFQNKNGFIFNSIDKLCDDGQQNFDGRPVIAEYFAVPSLDDAGSTNNYYVIEAYRFTTEIDLLDKMQRGVYSNKMVLFNYATAETEEIVYNMKDTFDNMAKLGYQDNLPVFATTSGDDESELPPSRVMSMVIDNESWNFSDDVGDPEEGGDGGGYPDETKYLIAQGIARRNVLELQRLEINVPGNYNLTVGEKIKVYLPNMASQQERNKEQWDNESSGKYLISKLSHNFNMADETGQTFETSLVLIRDTYGMEEEPSKVKG